MGGKGDGANREPTSIRRKYALILKDEGVLEAQSLRWVLGKGGGFQKGRGLARLNVEPFFLFPEEPDWSRPPMIIIIHDEGRNK